MPVQEEERASGRPAAKAKPMLKRASTSEWKFIPVGQRGWIDIEVQNFKDPYCFQNAKIHHEFTTTQKCWARRRCRSSSQSNC